MIGFTNVETNTTVIKKVHATKKILQKKKTNQHTALRSITSYVMGSLLSMHARSGDRQQDSGDHQEHEERCMAKWLRRKKKYKCPECGSIVNDTPSSRWQHRNKTVIHAQAIGVVV